MLSERLIRGAALLAVMGGADAQYKLCRLFGRRRGMHDGPRQHHRKVRWHQW